MKIGIVGLEFAGKKTLFNILSRNGKNLAKRGAVEFALTPVIDPRVKVLQSIYNPKKTTFAQLEFILTPSISSEKKAGAQALNAIHSVDGIIIVVRDFALEGVDPPQPSKDLDFVFAEMVFSDLFKCESVMEKTEKRAHKLKEQLAEKELALLIKCKAWLEQEKLIKDLELNEEEKGTIRTFDFLTSKPVFVLVNIEESDIGKNKEYDLKGYPHDKLSVKIESEMVGLEEAEQKEFLKDLGLSEPGLDRLIHDSYRVTRLMSYFTVGEDEVKAWTIPEGTKSPRAAAAIHTDFEKGFIRAEVIHYEDLIKAGTEKEAKKLNMFRLEGKEYVVRDGDIINFRFNL